MKFRYISLHGEVSKDKRFFVKKTDVFYSGAPPSGAPYSYRKEKEFLMVVMASGIARGRVRTTTTTTTTATAAVEWPKMAAILQIIGRQTCSLGLPCTSLIFDIDVMIKLTPVKTRYPLTSITWLA